MAKGKKNKGRRRKPKPMIRVMPMLEAYVGANIATQNLFGGTPIEFLLGDLNATAGTGMLSSLMGPQPGVLTLKELLTGTFNVGQSGSAYTSPTAGSAITQVVGGPRSSWGGLSGLEIVAENFKDNLGTIIVSSALSTAGFRIANKILAKPRNKLNATLRQFNLGSTIQF